MTSKKSKIAFKPVKQPVKFTEAEKAYFQRLTEASRPHKINRRKLVSGPVDTIYLKG